MEPRNEKKDNKDLGGNARKDDDDDITSDRDEDDDVLSHPLWEEPCGFVLHLIVLLAAVLYVFYVVNLHFTVNASLILRGVPLPEAATRIPSWTWAIPLTLVVLFFAVPLLYGLLNAATFVSPKSGSPSILQDVYTIVPQFPSPLRRSNQDLSDTNAAWGRSVRLYYQRPREWIGPHSATTNTTAEEEDGSSNISSLPAIGDIDVADINDWVEWKGENVQNVVS